MIKYKITPLKMVKAPYKGGFTKIGIFFYSKFIMSKLGEMKRRHKYL